MHAALATVTAICAAFGRCAWAKAAAATAEAGQPPQPPPPLRAPRCAIPGPISRRRGPPSTAT